MDMPLPVPPVHPEGDKTTPPSVNHLADADPVLEHTFVLSIGSGRKSSDSVRQKVSLADLRDRWSSPSVNPHSLSSANYHALDKAKPEQKELRTDEKDQGFFTAAMFGGDGRRTSENVEKLTAFVLDFDSGNTTRKMIEERLSGTAYFAYTSYSHRPDEEHWRVVVPYTKPIDPERHEAIYDYFNARFDGDVDPNCKKPAQIYFTPAFPSDTAGDYQAFVGPGELFDPDTVPAPVKQNIEVDDAANAPAYGGDGEARLRDALKHLDPDEYDTWIDVGMAIKHDLGEAGLPAWLEWSKRSQKFDASEAVRKWQGFKPNAGPKAISLGTIYFKAKAAGWKDQVVPDHIARMNEEYFVAPLGNRFEIFREHDDPRTGHRIVTPIKREDFQLKFLNRFAIENGPDGKAKGVTVATAWLRHPARREYKGVVLMPNEAVPGYYNRWAGFAFSPTKGKWKQMRWHICFVICGGNRRLYRYVLNWMAFAVQRPREVAGVCLVLQGGRGAGKGMFVRAFGELFGKHFKHITHATHLTGKFNAHLADCLVLFADEAFWAGDKQGESALKGVITEPELSIERKNFDVEFVPNKLKIIMASNNAWVVPAGLDERRFCVLAVSNIRQQDTAYFKQLRNEIDSGGREAMLHDLLARDISKFEITNVPQTDALLDQKLLTLSGSIEGWWLEKLKEGEWPAPYNNSWTQVSKKVLQDDYVESLKREGVSRRASETAVGMALAKLLPPGWPKISKQVLPVAPMGSTARVPTYEFPPLADCRAYFEQVAHMKGYKWP
jgi:hypothetical protein